LPFDKLRTGFVAVLLAMTIWGCHAAARTLRDLSSREAAAARRGDPVAHDSSFPTVSGLSFDKLRTGFVTAFLAMTIWGCHAAARTLRDLSSRGAAAARRGDPVAHDSRFSTASGLAFDKLRTAFVAALLAMAIRRCHAARGHCVTCHREEPRQRDAAISWRTKRVARRQATRRR
jgi:hypothetical protein